MNAGNSTAYRTAAFTAPGGGPGAPLLRWYLWEGGFLVVGQAAGEVPAHSHHAIQISLKLDGAAAIRGTGGTWREGRGIIVRSDVEHSFDAQGGTGALLFVDPESSEGIWLQSVLMEDITFAPPARVERCVDELRAFIERPLEGMDPGDLVRHCVRAARMKPAHAQRASAPPTLTRRTPIASTSFSVNSLVDPMSRLTGFGATAATTAAICSRVRMPGA